MDCKRKLAVFHEIFLLTKNEIERSRTLGTNDLRSILTFRETENKKKTTTRRKKKEKKCCMCNAILACSTSHFTFVIRKHTNGLFSMLSLFDWLRKLIFVSRLSYNNRKTIYKMPKRKKKKDKTATIIKKSAKI